MTDTAAPRDDVRPAEPAEPALRDDAFVAAVHAARERDRGTNQWTAWWLGQAGFLITWEDFALVTDPYLSDSLTTKYAGTDKPHDRMTTRVVAPECLDFIDVITSTHNHTDHLDHETLWPLIAVNPSARLVIPEANRGFVARRLSENGTRVFDPDWPLGTDDGVGVTVGPFTITGVAAAHEDRETDERGRHHHLGHVITFGSWCVYHAGDNIGWPGMAARVREIAGPRRVDLALLPINGRRPQRRVPGNFWGDEAARFAAECGARLAVAMHYDMFRFNTATPDLFVRTCAELGVAHRVVANGAAVSSTDLA